MTGVWEWLANFLTQSLELFRCCVILKEYERGVILRFGCKHREISPGLHWLWPMNVENAITDHVVTTTSNTMPQSLTTLDGHAVTVATVVTWRTADISKLLLEVESHTEALRDATLGVISKHVATTNWADMRADKLAHEITIETRRRAKAYGIHVETVQFSDMCRGKSLRLWTANAGEKS